MFLSTILAKSCPDSSRPAPWTCPNYSQSNRLMVRLPPASPLYPPCLQQATAPLALGFLSQAQWRTAENLRCLSGPGLYLASHAPESRRKQTG